MAEKRRFPFFHKIFLPVAGVILVLLLSLLLWRWISTHSNQAAPAIMAQVRFEGNYRVGDGDWQKIEAGKHIPATEGDVTLRGNFHTLAPDGTYVGLYNGDMPIAFYVNHISLTFHEGNSTSCTLDTENPLYGASACGEAWESYTLTPGVEGPVTLRIHNPHRFGNETAVDALLSKLTFWSGIDFEKGILEKGEPQRNAGIFLMIVSFVLLGIALLSTLIHLKNSRLLWLLGLAVLFAGIYLIYSAEGIFFWRETPGINTVALGIAMILYMLFLPMIIVYFLDTAKKPCRIIVFCLGIADAVLLLLPMVTTLRFYDLWLWWVAIQVLASLAVIGCLVREFFHCTKQARCFCVGAGLPMLAFLADAAMTFLGIWKGGIASKFVCFLLFIAAMVVVLRIIPRGINAAATAKALETEKQILNAQLAESRISTMMSQIRPHFIYNTLGSIEQLCAIDPEKAGEMVHNFAKYLRGNFGELGNPRPIQMSQEMEHVHYYISIEKVRFPDMTFTFRMNSVDFFLPALTVQPIVENAVKHGLMKLEKGGTIQVVSYETDSHYCVSVEDDGVGFDTAVLQDHAHMGIRNIQERLKAMVSGTLELHSTPGEGTKVLIKIPKEVSQ